MATNTETGSFVSWQQSLDLPVDFLPGDYLFDCSFTPSTQQFVASRAFQRRVSVVPGDTVTTLSLSPNGPLTPTEPARLTAQLSGLGPTRIGLVSFYDGAVLLGTAPVNGNQAVWSVPGLVTLGPPSLRAEHAGDPLFNASVSATLAVDVALAQSATTLSSTDTQLALGKQSVFTATVSGKNPTGQVSFFDGTALLGTATLSAGKAGFSTVLAGVGTHTISAKYAGDPANAGSASTGLSQTVLQGTTALVLSASGQTPATPGSVVLLSASLSGDARGRTGSVSFYDGALLLSSDAIVDDKVNFSTQAITALGSHTLSARYAGDASFAGTDSVGVALTIEQAQSFTTLAVATNPAVAGKPLTLTAQVTGAAPGGTVAFYDQDKLLGTVNLQNGVATLATTINTAGVHALKAVYSGDVANLGSTSAILSQRLNLNPGVLSTIMQILLQ